MIGCVAEITLMSLRRSSDLYLIESYRFHCCLTAKLKHSRRCASIDIESRWDSDEYRQ